jgi:hypothetical protein
MTDVIKKIKALVPPGFDEGHLYELHGYFIMQRGDELGLIESGLDNITAKGRTILAAAYAAGWKPDWRHTAQRLASTRDPASDKDADMKLIEMLNVLRIEPTAAELGLARDWNHFKKENHDGA